MAPELQMAGVARRAKPSQAAIGSAALAPPADIQKIYEISNDIIWIIRIFDAIIAAQCKGVQYEISVSFR